MAHFARDDGDAAPLPPSSSTFVKEAAIVHKVPEVMERATNTAEAEAERPRESQLAAFARVAAVAPGSPAARGRVAVDDELLLFGYVNASNHNGLLALRDVVLANENYEVTLLVRRSGVGVVEVQVTPCKWSGRGLLGYDELPSFCSWR